MGIRIRYSGCTPLDTDVYGKKAVTAFRLTPGSVSSQQKCIRGFLLCISALEAMSHQTRDVAPTLAQRIVSATWVSTNQEFLLDDPHNSIIGTKLP